MFLTKLERILLIGFYVYIMLLGMTSLTYDTNKDKYSQPTFMQLYALLLNALTLLAFPLSVPYLIEMYDNILRYTFLMSLANRASLVITVLCAMFTALTRYTHEMKLQTFWLDLMRLERTHLKEWQEPRDAAIERKYHRMVYLNYALNGYLMVSGVVDFVWNSSTDLHSAVAMFFCVNVSNISTCILLIYNFLMLWLWRAYCYIYRQSELILEQCQNADSFRQQDLNEICFKLLRLQRAHWKLGEFADRLTDLYRYQLMGVHFDNNVYLLLLSYVTVLFFYMESINRALLGLCSYFLVSFQMLNAVVICEITVLGSMKSAQVIKQFTDLRRIPRQLRHRLDEMSLQFCNNQLSIDLFGLFTIDMAFWFSNFVGVFAYSIVLLQYQIAFGDLKILVDDDPDDS